jgi:NADP-dependent aldehyde dehydrogenase
MTIVMTTDPRTNTKEATGISESSARDVDGACRRAADAGPALADMGRLGRAAMLEAMARGLESEGDDIVHTADRETALGLPRLTGELARTCHQLRLFADVLVDGGYLEATIDHAHDSAMGPLPDTRRMLVPVGPVVVFGSSNFPLAFSVPGGDTASALAAGCPVIVKAHEAHPLTSQLCAQVLREAAGAAGAPAGTVELVFGMSAGAQAVAHPAVRAAGFTGSMSGGRALMEIAQSRPHPIPFFGELSSTNPLVVTASAAAERGETIGSGIAASALLGAGQFCTKPGVVLMPADESGEATIAAMSRTFRDAAPAPLLTRRVADGYAEGLNELAAHPAVTVVVGSATDSVTDLIATPALMRCRAADLEADMMKECFGPSTLVVTYGSVDELVAVLADLPGSLTSTIHSNTDETDLRARLVTALHDTTGRFVFDGYPTGVAVNWAQHHGGPWPSTNTSHSSVGATAIRRFLRPMAWQAAPVDIIPFELRDDAIDIPRRVDGVIVPISGSAPTGG